MELTIEQTLQQGVAAHKEGKLEEAERLYRAILQSQPTHPDANHNLGVIAVSVNKANAALSFFKTALETNPKIEQFWLSYIGTLLTENKTKAAKAAILDARKQGFDSEKINALENQLKQLSVSSKAPDSNISPSESQLNNLLELYQNGRYEEAEKLAVSITQQFPEHPFGWKALGVVLAQTDRSSESLVAKQKVLHLTPQDAEAHSNLGNTLNDLGRFEEAEASLKQAIALKPDFTQAHYNLGITLKELGRLEEAEASYTKAIALKSDYAEAHCSLAVVLTELGRLAEGEIFYKQAIALKSDYAEAHSNLGITLQAMGKFDEAEASCRQAIVLEPNHAGAHNNLGKTLQTIGKLEEAEASVRQAIALNPNFTEAYFNFSIIFAIKEDYVAALDSIKKANNLKPKTVKYNLLLAILKSRQSHKKSALSLGHCSKPSYLKGLISNPLILNRTVEPELIANLYDIDTRELDGTVDPRFGNGETTDYQLFENNRFIMSTVKEDLILVIKEALKSDVFIEDSFFNIFRAGSGITPHKHLGLLDITKGLDLFKQKYSLVYYLCVGDQNCSEPGILKLYDPSEDILPSEGMITIFPASRTHSAVYNGKTDRVMIGINFYTL
jgi:tetratricopeptide (TPR) repeat protein